MPSLTSLAEEILENAKRLDSHLASQNLPSPSFDHDTLAHLPPSLEPAREALINSAHTLKLLSQGPVQATTDIAFNWADFLTLRAVYTYKLPHLIPLDGSATYASIATASNLPLPLTRRFIRHAMANHIFAPSPHSPDEQVRHTAASRLLVTDPDFFDAVGMQVAELGVAGGSMMDAIAKYGDSGEQEETAFSVANGSKARIYEILAREPERARRFGAGMRFWAKGEGWDLRHLVQGFDWVGCDREGVLVVDVGGGQGSVSLALAKATVNIRFKVFDLPGTVEQGRKALPREFRDRVEFVAHDFFESTERVVEGGKVQKKPDVYLFRWILHNWSDGYCVKILRNLIPSLEQGTRVVIYEFVLNDEPETSVTEKMGLNLDMIMAACFNGAERTKGQWIDLIHAADERFAIRNIVRPAGSMMSVIEVVWNAGK